MEKIEQDKQRRFSSLERLYGDGMIQRLANHHVVIVGVGGVGSWAVEALVRSGIGRLTLIDLDNVAESNINRQIHSLDSTLGLSKIAAMNERIQLINNHCQVTLYEEYLTTDNLANFNFGDPQHTWIIDAIDQVKAKAALIAYAKTKKFKIITTGAAGGKKDSAQLTIVDLSATYHDALCSRLKQVLRKEYGFPRAPKKMNIPVVFSKENSNSKTLFGGLGCSGYGSIVTVTASMGMMAAGYVINAITRE